jgi:hypothetical protein
MDLPLDISPADARAPEADKVFADPAMSVKDFRFDVTVAAAFDDMVSRSVPSYDEMQRMVVELAADFLGLMQPIPAGISSSTRARVWLAVTCSVSSHSPAALSAATRLGNHLLQCLRQVE